jgi:hypothetical protein
LDDADSQTALKPSVYIAQRVREQTSLKMKMKICVCVCVCVPECDGDVDGIADVSNGSHAGSATASKIQTKPFDIWR